MIPYVYHANKQIIRSSVAMTLVMGFASFTSLLPSNVSARDRADWVVERQQSTTIQWGPASSKPRWEARPNARIAGVPARASYQLASNTGAQRLSAPALPSAVPHQFAQAQPPVSGPPTSLPLPTRAAPSAPPSGGALRLNPTSRTITLPVPISDGITELGEVALTIGTDDALSVERVAFLSVIAGSITEAALKDLKLALGEVSLVTQAQLVIAGYPITYDPDKLSLRVALPITARGTRTLKIADLDRARIGTFERPARFSAFVNLRTNLDYTSTGANQGLSDPQLFFDGAARFANVVAEYEATIRTGNSEANGFTRQGTRFIYDDMPRTLRWTLGDLSTSGRGFQGSTPSGGISVARSYAQLQPQRDVRPRGDQSITVLRPSTVEAFVNERSVRRFRLDPGTYRLTDFPFTEGSNDVRLEIVDDAGKRDIVSFDLFFNRTLLQPGTSEFSASLGVESEIVDGVIEYDTDKPYLSGYYVRGINNRLTAGGNVQISKTGRVVGLESVISLPFGTLAADVGLSDRDDVGSGVAANMSFSRLVAADARKNAIGATFSVEYRSENFSSVFGRPSTNPFEFQLGASLSRSIGQSAFILADVRHSVARGSASDITSARVSYGHRLTSVDSISVDMSYSKTALRDDVGFRVAYTRRFGERGTLRADYDSASEQAGLAYQTSRGFGVGAYSANADLRRSEGGIQGAIGANYTANRADIGLNHSISYASSTSNVEDSRTSLRVGTALAFADGKLALSRPISDGFAMVAAHPSLKGANIEIEPREGGYESRSGMLGPAVVPALSAFVERQISFDVPNAPAGYDLGAGNIRVLPPLHAGYLAIVGSDYSVTVVGKLMDRDGVALAFVSGKAFEVGQPDREPVVLFTNREGRFGASGLRPGQWRIEMGGEQNATYLLSVPANAVGIVQIGTLQVSEPAQ
jgi:outer membrane usher protein